MFLKYSTLTFDFLLVDADMGSVDFRLRTGNWIFVSDDFDFVIIEVVVLANFDSSYGRAIGIGIKSPIKCGLKDIKELASVDGNW